MSPRRNVVAKAGVLRGFSASLLASERKLQKNRRFASCIRLRHLIRCFCVLVRKGSGPGGRHLEPFFVAQRSARAALGLCLPGGGKRTTLLDEARGSFFHPLELSGFFRRCHCCPYLPLTSLRA